MLTGMYGIGRFSGAEVVLLANGLWLMLCVGGSFLFRCNRTPGGRRRLLWGIFLAAAFCDAVMFWALFPHGNYVNHGIGAAWGMLVYPAVVFAAAALLTAWNRHEA